MSNFDFGRIPLFGPSWWAEVEILRKDSAQSQRDFCELFVDLVPNTAAGRNALEARTVVALCFVHSVKLKMDGSVYDFNRGRSSDDSYIPQTPDALRNLVREGRVSLLLVEVQPPLGSSGYDDKLYCLAGEINLDSFGSQPKRKELFRALGLTDLPEDERHGRPGLAVHGSGLSVQGRIRLPWEDASIAAPFLLTKNASRFRMTVDLERMTQGERDALASAWNRLARALNPGNPSFDPKGEAKTPAWANLEVVNPLSAPRLYWEMSPWRPQRAGPLPVRVPRNELNLRLSDQRPNARQTPPTSFAHKTSNSDPVIRRKGINILVELGESQASGGANEATPQRDLLRYSADLPAEQWKERFTLAGVMVAFNPVEVPRLLRQIQSLVPPEWSAPTPDKPAVPMQEPVLWAAMRLEDGWAELPVPNLTEQMYLDAGIADMPDESTPPSPPMLQGAVSYGNDKPEVDPLERRSEQAWSVTLTDIGKLAGRWTLAGQSGPTSWSLQKIELALHEPKLVLQGLFWLGTERTSARDALPSLDDWASGLRSVALRTPAKTDMFPPLVTLTIHNLSFQLRRPSGQDHAFPSAELGAWSFTYGVDAELLTQMEANDLGLLRPGTFRERLPLVWRRHPTLPMIQALPLTQLESPPNHPSPSRQLMPFELQVDATTHLPKAWCFGVVSPQQGARAWPSLLEQASVAAAWSELADLPMVSLSLPGLVLDARAKPANIGLGAMPVNLGLNARYRFDLPYCDELHALAQIQKERGAPSPLSRDALTEHWGRLSEMATLASADAVDAIVAEEGDTHRHFVQSLVEPLQWPIEPTLSLDAYPGELILANRDGTDGQVTLRGTTALEGISGSFVQDQQTGQLHVEKGARPKAYVIVAGSMQAHADDSRKYRDQRGLWRDATRRADNLLRTPVRLHEQPKDVDLVTTTKPLQLSPGGSAACWQLWFRDLPSVEGSFLRTDTRSGCAQDVNDPGAADRDRNHLNGYEWRLSPGKESSFSLFHLTFHPLTLERVQFKGDRVIKVELVGRLQLPVLGAGEMQYLGNAVRVTFEPGQAGLGLALSAVTLESTACEWPLALSDTGLGDAPRIVVTQLAPLDPDRPELRVTKAQIVFVLFGAKWTVPLAPFAFSHEPDKDIAPVLPAKAPARPLAMKTLALTLDRQTGRHALSVHLEAQLGMKDPHEHGRSQVARALFHAEVTFSYEPESQSWQPTWRQGRLFHDLHLVIPSDEPSDPPLVATPGSLEFTWRACEHPLPASGGLQLLPGMHLAPGEAQGFVALCFDVQPVPDGVPSLELRSSFVEALLRCDWGEPLQVEGTFTEATRAQVFGSSTGNLAFGYTAEGLEVAEQKVIETLLLNGYLEVKDLVSWPVDMGYDAAHVQLTLPDARRASSLNHVRHTLKILFNQHEIPRNRVVVSGAPQLLFQLAPEHAEAWQFLAIVEHQLVDVFPSVDFESFRVGNDRRWTALQEVRLLSPATFASFLEKLGQVHYETLSPDGLLAQVAKTFSGYLGGELRKQLAAKLPPARDPLPSDTLLVEASALHWIKLRPVERAIQTTLQFLPGGIQQAILSGPDDYVPDPTDPRWQLLTMPFLGRLQDRGRDGLDPKTASSLQVDPVLTLQALRRERAPLPPLALELSSWAPPAPAPATFTFPAFDDAAARTWTRLDPSSLEQSWLRLQHPLREPDARGIQSVLAALPDTPTRASRSTALRHAFDWRRSPAHATTSAPRTPDRGSEPVQWGPGRMLVIQKATQDATFPAWALTALQLMGSGLMRPAPEPAPRQVRHVAATALAVELAQALLDNTEALEFSLDDWPVSLAVSPYLGLGFRPAPQPESTVLRVVMVAELLCLDLDRRRHALRSSGSHVLHGQDAEELRARALTWARETHRLLAPESPIAILRLRQLRQSASENASDAVLTTSYAFMLVSGLMLPDRLTRRTLPLRAPLAELRFRDGHFGGTVIPTSLADVELAAPLVTGVQPMYNHAPTPVARWGLSALRTTVQYTQAKEGMVGARRRDGATTAELVLWWQSMQHAVQFRSAAPADGPVKNPDDEPTAGLPSLFRAPAIRSLLPVLPDPRLPHLVGEERPLATWQPVLPGSVSYTLVGARPGVMLSMRHHIVRHTGPRSDEKNQEGRSVVSGSVPVQHRAPRPIPLPRNNPARPEAALRTWASQFDPCRSALVTTAPADEAFFIDAKGAAHRLRMRLVEPTRGAVHAGWDDNRVFTLVFELASDQPNPLEAWTVSVDLRHDGRRYIFNAEEPSPGKSGYEVSLANDKGRALFSRLGPGQVVTVRACVGRKHDGEGFEQTLWFPLRVTDPNALPLPLEPSFIHFEDPEYNGKLSTPSKRASWPVQTRVAGRAGVSVRVITLAADRGECNPDSVLMLRFDWDDDVKDHAQEHWLSFDRVTPDGVSHPLRIRRDDGTYDKLPVEPAKLVALALLDLHQSDLSKGEDTAPFARGESLLLTLAVKGGRVAEEAKLVLPVGIVDTPVNPVPEAAYALLRRQGAKGGKQVECVRFAWNPEPNRIELVHPGDLRTELVRRRAVFQWIDTVRGAMRPRYDIQKVTHMGSTHIPGVVLTPTGGS